MLLSLSARKRFLYVHIQHDTAIMIMLRLKLIRLIRLGLFHRKTIYY